MTYGAIALMGAARTSQFVVVLQRALSLPTQVWVSACAVSGKKPMQGAKPANTATSQGDTIAQ
jgi:hypothetical protein